MGDIRRARTVEELVPHLNWIEDLMKHYLLVHLPGCRKEEMEVGLAYPGYVTISGERIVNDKKCTYFGQALKLPENLDMKKVGQSFEDEILTLTFPKRTEEEEEENKNGNPSTTKKSLQEEKEKQKEVSNEQN
ncbi:15.4 kDa class V heat shock protein-like [Gossypium arboreum]|uniref:15.4 kDa class V heat shock protein-like n=1 Tax=Gossypium arboreum TaxID=29729 RepID=UPI0022F1BBDE|nr:15.4 kDa class V heat shock protein-like [Gossypium arboreum]